MSEALPKDWSWRTVGDIGKVITGSTPPTADASYWGGSIPFVTPTDLGTTSFIRNTGRSLSQEGAARSRLLPPKSVLVTCIASIGKNGLAAVECCTNQQINAVVCDTASLPEYIYYAFCGNVDELRRLAGITAVSIVSKGKFERFCLPCPPIAEQRRIAAILSAVDNAIESTQAVIDQIQVVKKSMMAELLTRGLPGRHTRFKQTDIGDVPEDWDVMTLESATRTITVGHVGPTSDGYASTGIAFLRTGNIKNGGLDLSDLKYITPAFHDRLGKSKIYPGDVLVSRVGNTGGAALVPPGFPAANCANIIVIRPGADTVPLYLRHYLNGPAAARQSAGLSAGSAQAVLNIGAIKKLLVARPSREEQDEICGLLSAVEERQIAEHTFERGLTEVKAALMSALLTGELRVTPDEAAP